MCAGSDGRIGSDEFSLYLGYYGGSLTIGENVYNQEGRHEDGQLSREEAYKVLDKYKKDELIKFILTIVDNSEE